MGLDHPAYNTTVRKGFHGHTFRACVLTAVSASCGVALLRRFAPSLTKDDHALLARQHAESSLKHKKLWNETVEQASLATFGRSFEFGDYRVAGVASDLYSPEHKSALWTHCRSKDSHHQLAVLHFVASGRRHHTAIDLCRAIGL
jgi:hypothetical protein